MSFLTRKNELKKIAKELPVTKLKEIIDLLNAVFESRKEETEALDKVREFAKAQGFTLEQLGYTSNANESESVSASSTEKAAGVSERPRKPKFKTINKENQFFYVEDGELKLLKTHTMKDSLKQRGIDVVPFSKLEKKHVKLVDGLVAEAAEQALISFNAKVDVWNIYAAAHNEEILEKR